MSGRLDGMVAVITGAASGIGAGTARRFVAEGASVVLADIQQELGESLAAELGDSALFALTNVTSEDDVAATVDMAVDQWGRLDVMFNNAGILGAVGSIAHTPLGDWERTISVLLTGAFLGSKHAARVMVPRGSGSIINTSSIAGVTDGRSRSSSQCRCSGEHDQRHDRGRHDRRPQQSGSGGDSNPVEVAARDCRGA